MVRSPAIAFDENFYSMIDMMDDSIHLFIIGQESEISLPSSLHVHKGIVSVNYGLVYNYLLRHRWLKSIFEHL